VIGAPTTEERGMATKLKERALALSEGESQSYMDRDIAGKWGPSVAPRKKRIIIKVQRPVENPSKAIQIDQAMADKGQTLLGFQMSTIHPPREVSSAYPIPKAERIIPN